MKAIIIDGYIFGLSEINGVDISAEREEEIRLAVREKPIAEDGYAYHLTEGLTWELFELPPVIEPEWHEGEAH